MTEENQLPQESTSEVARMLLENDTKLLEIGNTNTKSIKMVADLIKAIHDREKAHLDHENSILTAVEQANEKIIDIEKKVKRLPKYEKAALIIFGLACGAFLGYTIGHAFNLYRTLPIAQKTDIGLFIVGIPVSVVLIILSIYLDRRFYRQKKDLK